MDSNSTLAADLTLDVLEHAPAALVVTRVEDGRILFANRRFRDLMFEGRSEGIPEISPDYYVHPEDRAPILKELQEIGRVVDHEVQFRTLGGEVLWTYMNMSRVSLGGEEVLLSHLTDITRLKKVESDLRRASLRYDRLIKASPDSIFIVDASGTIQFASPRAGFAFGMTHEAMVGTKIFRWVHPDDHQRLLARSDKVRECSVRDWTGPSLYRMLRPDGTMWWAEINSESSVDEDGSRQMVSIVRDVTEKRLLQEQVEFQAAHDVLTGLPNRALLYDRAAVMIAACDRNETQFALLFVDLDGFKPINDAYGHAKGDEVLCEIAERLSGAFRKSDTVARVGGDEFVILVGDISDENDVANAIEKALVVLEQPSKAIPAYGGYSASIGSAVYREHGCTTDDLVRRADSQMYANKRSAQIRYGSVA